MTYSFTCPLVGCHNFAMHTDAQNSDNAAKDLTIQAKAHLSHAHPEIHKTDEEIDQDIRSHMVTKNDA